MTDTKKPPLSKADKWQAAHGVIANGLRAGIEPKAIIDELIEYHGATYRTSCGDAQMLRIAGCTSTCTAGIEGLLYNWKLNATLRIMKANQQ
tara:strand:+ start:1511 stop:1786 length:276 start_codon:yes stop_codon:yes gene_type:complete